MEYIPDEIIKLIRSSAEERRLAIKSIACDLKLKNDIISYVLRNSGTSDDGIMLFHDSIVAFVKKVFSTRSFVLKGSIQGYIYGISRNLWLTKLNKETRNPVKYAGEVNNKTISEVDNLEIFINNDRARIIRDVMNHLKVNCKQVLMYWAGGYKMKEIAQLLGYKTEGVVRKKKYECYKELTTWLNKHPDIKSELE